MTIYTRSGDDGTTGLFGGCRVSKSDLRIECLGCIDELNASLGLAAVAAPQMAEFLQEIQRELFAVNSHIATPADAPARAHLPPLDETMLTRLEAQIDSGERELRPLRHFILPGGSEAAARLHLARTICRRTERAVVSLSHQEQISGFIIRYLNRLGDWLFVHARLANQQAGVNDVPWKP
jgi:cob(I)alamin adenosyltransferase